MDLILKTGYLYGMNECNPQFIDIFLAVIGVTEILGDVVALWSSRWALIVALNGVLNTSLDILSVFPP